MTFSIKTKTTKALVFMGIAMSGAIFPNASFAGPIKVAVLGAPSTTSWNTDVQTKLTATGLFSQVDVINVASSTPTLATMQTYAAVLVFSDSNFSNPTQLGNNLADYVDSGGGVVEAVFANASVPLSGRYVSGGYYGINSTGQTQGSQLSLGTIYDLNSPIMAGITNFNGGSSSYRSTGSLTAGAVRVADWSNGAPLVVTKTIGGHTTVDLNFYPPSSSVRSDLWNASTQGGLLMANALVFASGTATAAVPEPASVALFGIGLAGLMLRHRKNA